MSRTSQIVLGAAAAAVDEAVRRTALARPGGHRRIAAVDHATRIARMEGLYQRYRELGAFQRFFREPRDIDVTAVERLREPDLRVIDLSWPSDDRTFLPEVQAQFDRYPDNRRAAARLVVHDRPRPAVVLIHGYLGGVHRTERRVWPMDFFHRIGVDVALFVLPFHGQRAPRRRLGERPPFPGADPRVTNEGFRQAMGDLRDLVRWLRARHPSVGVMGMSLGGCSTALAATLERELSFAVPMIPLASLADVARAGRHLAATPDETAAEHAALDRVLSVASPLHRPALVAPERVMVVGAEFDRITPVAHARKLADHFRCRLELMPGGHLVQIGRGDRFRSIARFLNERGVIQRPA
jgi:pimeloyl-ACP methyl ester carboxylesterase